MTQDRAGKVCGARPGYQGRNEEPETGKAKPRVKARSSGTGLGGPLTLTSPALKSESLGGRSQIERWAFETIVNNCCHAHKQSRK